MLTYIATGFSNENVTYIKCSRYIYQSETYKSDMGIDQNNILAVIGVYMALK